jgi:hypothetical protein
LHGGLELRGKCYRRNFIGFFLVFLVVLYAHLFGAEHVCDVNLTMLIPEALIRALTLYLILKVL